jgi:hypothetical protein
MLAARRRADGRQEKRYIPMASSSPKLQGPKPWPIPPGELQEAVRRRAQQIYEASGGIAGRDADNWRQAEAEISREYAERFARKPAIVVKVEGVRYVGEYSPALSDGYAPGEWGRGDAVSVRFQGDKMYARRPNGKELETRIVRSVG